MIGNNLQSYADLYKGAVMNLSNKTPGYVRFVAHAVRDMGNGMAAYKLGRKRQQVDYVKIVGKLSNQWKMEGLPKGFETLTLSDLSGVSIADEHMTISKEIVLQIQQLFNEHEKGRERSEDSPYLFFEAFLPNQTSRDSLPQAHLNMWKDLQKWFLTKCHENGTIPDNDVVEQIDAKFTQLEDIILSVADRYTNTIKTLDEILAKANS